MIASPKSRSINAQSWFYSTSLSLVGSFIDFVNSTTLTIPAVILLCTIYLYYYFIYPTDNPISSFLTTFHIANWLSYLNVRYSRSTNIWSFMYIVFFRFSIVIPQFTSKDAKFNFYSTVRFILKFIRLFYKIIRHHHGYLVFHVSKTISFQWSTYLKSLTLPITYNYTLTN